MGKFDNIRGQTQLLALNTCWCISYCKLLFLGIWECLIINKEHFLYLKILNVADRLKYETVSEAGNDSEFNFHFHIHKLDADYRKI